MPDLTAQGLIPIVEARSTYSQRRRWRVANTALTASLSAMVVATSIYFGVTGPTTSPVNVSALTTSTTAVTSPGTGITTAGGSDSQQAAFSDHHQGGHLDGFGGQGGRGR